MFKIDINLYNCISLAIIDKDVYAVNKKEDECDGCLAICNSTLNWHHK